MARRRKGSWKRKGETKDTHWYTTFGKKTVKVADGTDTYKQAFEKYTQILADKGETDLDSSEPLTVKNLVVRFLAWVKSNRSPNTHAFYERYLNSFVAHSGSKRVTAIMPPTWSSGLLANTPIARPRRRTT